MRAATPRQAFLALVLAGVLVLVTYAGLVAVEVFSGTATKSTGRRKPPIIHLRAENPAGYWGLIREKALVGGCFGGGLIALGFIVLRINRKPGAGP